MEKLNREQRRQAKFGGGRASEQGGWPTSEPNPVFAADEAVEAEADSAAKAPAAGPDKDQTKKAGPGTGGATKQAGRAPRHEGAKAANSTKG
jgi:hypothetical protein